MYQSVAPDQPQDVDLVLAVEDIDLHHVENDENGDDEQDGAQEQAGERGEFLDHGDLAAPSPC